MKPLILLPFAAAVALAAAPAAPAMAQQSGFAPGPVIERFGAVTPVETDVPIPAGASFKHAFDVSQAATAGELNRQITSAARFTNMLAQAGVSPDRIRTAVVVHADAVRDVTKSANPSNKELVAALLAHGGEIYVCGQSAAAQSIAKESLLPGVRMALSAMSAHALLQQQGYTLNPF